MSDFISESNRRSAFNYRMANILGVPYACGVARMPHHMASARIAGAAHERLISIREVDKYLQSHRLLYEPFGTALPLPVFLTIVVLRSRRRADMWYEIRQLRREFRVFRRRRAEYEQALFARPSEVAKLRKALMADAKRVSSNVIPLVAQTAAATLAAVTSNTAAAIVSGIALFTMLGQFDDDRRAAVARRLLRPHEWLLTNLVDEVKAISGSMSDLRRLWPSFYDDERTFTAHVGRIATLHYG